MSTDENVNRESEKTREKEKGREWMRDVKCEKMGHKCVWDRRINKILLPSGLESQPMGIIKRK